MSVTVQGRVWDGAHEVIQSKAKVRMRGLAPFSFSELCAATSTVEGLLGSIGGTASAAAATGSRRPDSSVSRALRSGVAKLPVLVRSALQALVMELWTFFPLYLVSFHKLPKV
jgi:hypothetical protein